jgi:hypothetical protein
MSIKNRFIHVLFIFFMLCSNAYAYTWNQISKVTVVEATYMPKFVSFYIASMPSECQGGLMLLWFGKGNNENEKFSNAKSIFIALMAAQASGNSIQVFGSGCQVDYLHLFGS